MRLKIYDAAGPTPSLGRLTAPELDTVSKTRLVETATFRNGPFEGDIWQREFIGYFDFSKERGKVDEIRILVDSERHYQFDFDRRLDLYHLDAAYSSAFRAGVEFIGNRHANRFIGDQGNDWLTGGAGDDVLDGHIGDDVLRGGGGADKLIGDTENDRLSGGSGDDQLIAGDGADVLRGGSGADLLVGMWWEDRLVGGPGNDRLDGGEGADQLTGGGGADVFEVYSDVLVWDRITDFRPGRDLIDVSTIDARADRPGHQSFHFIGNEPFSGRTGELRFDGHRLTGAIYVNSGGVDFVELVGVDTISEADLLL